MAESGAGETHRDRGLQFAERQLLRHGWEQGKGLGRGEKGISEAIKVKVKCDKGGIGHREGDQFTFHWWDHVFNQTSASLQVESDHAGATLHKNSGENEGAISNKKPLKYSLAKDKLYGAFVKSATLVSGLERAVEKASSDSSSSDEDESKLDLSSTTKLSDAELVKVCGGRTAHKGARHGLKMSAKLARLEQQEAEFMAKYGKKTTQPEKEGDMNGASEGNAVKTKKKKMKSKNCEEVERSTCLDVGEIGHAEGAKRKKKKRKRDDVEEIQIQQNDNTPESPPPRKKKKKKSKE